MTKEQVFYEDNDIIVCYKPAGIATQTARVGQRDMVSEAANYLSAQSADKGQAAGQSRSVRAADIQAGRRQPDRKQGIYVVHRLDQPVEGILVFAKHSKAAATLGRQITENRMEKYYYAVVDGTGISEKKEQPVEAEKEAAGTYGETLTDYLVKDSGTNMSRIAAPGSKEAKKAVLEYEIVERKGLFPENFPKSPDLEENPVKIAFIRIRLITGRHHQIRVQMSHAGMSLLGDYKYACERAKKLSDALRIKQIALCAYRLDFTHPVSGKKLSFQTEPKGDIFRHFVL